MHDIAILSSNRTRRQLLAGVAITVGGLATGIRLFAQPPAIQQTPAAPSDKRTSLQNIVPMKASPQRIYATLLDAKQFAVFSGMPAEIDPKEGGAFTLFHGQIVGRNIELVPNLRIVQAWRPAHWDPGIYSVAHFELKPTDTGTTIVFDHTGFPEGEYASLDWGWHNHYWDRLQKFLA